MAVKVFVCSGCGAKTTHSPKLADDDLAPIHRNCGGYWVAADFKSEPTFEMPAVPRTPFWPLVHSSKANELRPDSDLIDRREFHRALRDTNTRIEPGVGFNSWILYDESGDQALEATTHLTSTKIMLLMRYSIQAALCPTS